MEAPAGSRIRGIFRKGVSALKDAGIENPALDAAVLLGHVTCVPASGILMNPDATMTTTEVQLYDSLIRERCGHITVSRLVGNREFYSRDFYLNDDVLDPRPETEILVQEAMRRLDELGGSLSVLDIGTGSGCIAVTVAAEDPRVQVTATDISMAALTVARRNSIRHGVADRVNFVRADLTGGLRKMGGFHLVLSNPPYVSLDQYKHLHEDVRNGDPIGALISGPEGAEFYQPLVEGSRGLLRVRGTLMVEVGDGQGPFVADLFERAGYVDVQIVDDLAGKGRVVKGNRKSA